MSAMQFRVLGTLEAVADGAVAELGPPKQRALLAGLLLHVGEIVSVDRLTELLWGESPPRTAPHSIQIYVSDLRRALEPLGGSELIVTRPPGYALEVDRDSVDAWRFERLVHEGARLLEAGDREAGRSALQQALGLWRGPALADFAYEEFAQPYIQRLNEKHLDTIESLAAAELEAGRTTEVVGLLQAAVLEDPLRERSRELLMLALYRSGRHADALRTFDLLRTQLADELGVDPSPRLRELYDRILLHDPSLLPAAAAPAAAEARNPYKGLRAFTEQDAADFFGRDDLVEQLLTVLAGGARLVSLVGPSGSGKSSVVAAGLVPRLRAGALPGSEHWRIGRMVPGANMLREAEAIVGRQGARGGEAPGGGFPTGDGTDWTLLVIDQFEQAFGLADEAARRQFLDAIAGAVTSAEARLRVVLTLRADFYDRPLLHPAFAAVFNPSVVNVVPMTAPELEAAVIEPARRVGVEVEPALRAELVADTADRPGSLPLLQYALTELFDRRTGPTLTRAGYATLGGLRGLLSRRAESIYDSLDPDGQRAAMQVFLRLVRTGGGAADSRRRVALFELGDTGTDSVVLSTVLTAFGRGRLLTFDRDPVSGQATIEVAHEALFGEWERLAGWIDRHRAVLRRHGVLVAAAEEWELAGHDPDYLLAGTRLAEFEPWLTGGVLQLSGRERAFLEAGVERRRAVEEAERARLATQRRSERRARWRFAVLAVVVFLLAGGLTYALVAGLTRPTPVVALVGLGEGVVWDQVESGFDRAVADFDVVGRKIEAQGVADAAAAASFDGDARLVSETGPALVILFDLVDVDAVARDFPGVRYLAFNAFPGELPNVAYAWFRDWEGAYLAGAAAALTTRTGTVGVVGAWDAAPIWGFVAGFEAGAHRVEPDTRVLVEYLAGTDAAFGRFEDPAAGESAARGLFERDADIVFNVAGTSGLGVFQAAADMSAERGSQLWAIGVDSDQYETVAHLPGVTQADEWRPHILTSMLKRFDAIAYDAIGNVAAGTFSTDLPSFDLASGYLDISYSGGFIDDLETRIDALKDQIVRGEIQVRCVPDDRLEVVRAAAAKGGATLEEALAFLCQ